MEVHLSPVYMIQPVVKPVVKPVWQPGKCLYTRYNQLSNPLSNPLYCVYKHSTGCQTVWQLVVQTVVSYIQPVVKPVWQLVERTVAVRSTRLSNPFHYRFDNRQYRVYEHSTGYQTGLTTGWMFVYMIQPVVKPVVQAVWQLKRGIKQQSTQQQALYTQQWSSQCRPMSIILNSTSLQILLFY